MRYQSKIIATGSYLPETILTNADLSQHMDTNDEWIRSRVGIAQRHIVKPHETTAFLGAEAAKEALKNAGLVANDLDMIIVATTSPDRIMPATAVSIQAAIGMTRGCAFDMQAVCAGFIFALTTAHQYIQSGMAKTIMVIGVETMSRLLDWSDRRTAILFGDGAGAVILTRDNAPGILGSVLHSDGGHEGILHTSGGVSTGTIGTIQMNGAMVMKQAILKMVDSMREVLDTCQLTVDDIDWLIPHQANIRIIQAVGEHLGIPNEKVVVTVDRHANTSAATIPLALHEVVKQGKVAPGQLIAMTALGAGISWGSLLLRW